MPPIGATNQLALLGGGLGYTQGGAPASVLGYQESAPAAPVDNTSTNYSGGGSTGPTAAQIAAQKAAAQQAAYNSQAQGLIGQLNTIYNQIYGNIDQTAETSRSNLDNAYGNQRADLNNQYLQNQQHLPWMYAARGLGDSSFNYDAQQNANQTYNQGTKDINDDETAKLQSLAGQINQEKAGYQAKQDYYNNTVNPNIAQYANPYFISQLGNEMVNSKTALGGYGSGGDFVNKLNAIAPSQSSAPSALQKQLSDLSGASVPQFAKDQVASGIINTNAQNPSDQNYFLNYWKGLTNGGATTA